MMIGNMASVETSGSSSLPTSLYRHREGGAEGTRELGRYERGGSEWLANAMGLVNAMAPESGRRCGWIRTCI